MARKELNKDLAYKYWPLGSRVKVGDFEGVVTDVRKHKHDWWKNEFKINGNSYDYIWALEDELKFADIWEEFERLLKAHDWLYQMSDDFSVWRSGRDARDELDRLYKGLTVIDEPRTIRLWKKYAQVVRG
jgi:hypothetical protein